MDTVVTTDLNDSFAVFETNYGYEVRPVYPSGITGLPLDIYESKASALAHRDDLVKHIREWADVVR